MTEALARGGPRAWGVHAVLITLAEAAIVVVAIAYVVTGSLELLVVWEAGVVVYLVGGLAVVIRQGVEGSDADRVGVLGALSWVLPLVSSVVGVYSAVVALTAQGNASKGDGLSTGFVVAASIGIILSWILLQVGMAQSYQAVYLDEHGDGRMNFPQTPKPVLLDFLYFSFAIGAAFATSDTQVVDRRVRLLVIVHSAVGFFYNAGIIAVAFQVLQVIVPSTR